MASIKGNNDKVQHILLELMVEQMYFTVPINIAVSFLVGIVIAPNFGVINVALWVIMGMTIGVGRVILFKRIMPNYLATQQYLKITKIIAGVLIIGGLHWGLAAWFFLDPQDPNIFLFVAVAILGMVSASLANLSAIPILWLLYTSTVFIFVVARMIVLENWPVVVMGCLFVFGLWGLSRQLGQQILASITKDFQNSELLEEIKKAKEKVEQTSLEKSRFMAATSHDLRQPLHAQGLLLAAMKGRIETDEQKNLLNKIIRSNKSLNLLFDSLLEISQLDANTIQVNKSHQSFFTLCEDLMSEFEPAAREKSLSLELVGNNCTVFSDPVLLKRIIRNLLSNAIKYTQHGGVILKLEHENEAVILSVIDTGIGIPESKYKAVFDEYVQLNNKTRDRNKGVGLGLALVKRMCALLKHRIELVSILDKGSCFTLTVPVGDSSKIVKVEKEYHLSNVKGLTIFVIDDEEPILDSMRILESDWECCFKLFSSFEQAQLFSQSDGSKPDVIVSDYRLSETMSGIDVITKLRTLYQCDIPALLISGDTDSKLLSEVQSSGLYMLHKPIDAEQLKAVIAILGNH